MTNKDVNISSDKDIIWITKYQFGDWVLLAQMVGSDLIDNTKGKYGYEIWLTNQKHNDLKIKLDRRIKFEDEIDNSVIDLLETGRIKEYINSFLKLSGAKNLKNYIETIEE